MKLSRKVVTHEFIPPSQMTVEIEPAVPGKPAVWEKDSIVEPEVPEKPAVMGPCENAAVFIFKALKRREYTKIMMLLAPDEKGDVKFDLETAYFLAAMVLREVRNVIVENAEGTGEGPLEIEIDEKGMVLEEIMDLFEPRDVFAFALHIIETSQVKKSQGKK